MRFSFISCCTGHGIHATCFSQLGIRPSIRWLKSTRVKRAHCLRCCQFQSISNMFRRWAYSCLFLPLVIQRACSGTHILYIIYRRIIECFPEYLRGMVLYEMKLLKLWHKFVDKNEGAKKQSVSRRTAMRTVCLRFPAVRTLSNGKLKKIQLTSCCLSTTRGSSSWSISFFPSIMA